MSRSGLASVSVDLDSLAHYCRIHGLNEALLDERAHRVIYGTALCRFEEVFAQAHLPGTYFAIGADLEAAANREALQGAHARGMEVASHSHSHDYALSRWTPEAIQADLQKAHDTLLAVTGKAPVGFRAPGYTLSPALLQAVQKLGYLYDSSTFPAVPYYLAKALVMGTLAMFNRRSGAILDSPRVLWAPTTPYRATSGRPYVRAPDGLWELPISTVPYTRFPFIGTFVLTFPEKLVSGMYQRLRQTPFLNFELHALDLLDADDGLPRELVARQRELRVPHRRKMERLAGLLSRMRQDFDVVTLAEAATRLSS